MKNIRLWIAAAVIMLALLCVGAASAEIIASGDCGAEGDNVTWTLDSEGVLSITGTGAMADYDNLDSDIGGPATPWSSHLSEIKSAMISEGVTTIGGLAFDCCTNLTSIAIPDSVVSIGNYAFSGCSSLTSIDIPDGVTTIGEGLFKGCINLTSIVIPDGVTSIGNSAFDYCKSLTSIAIPDSVTSIGTSAFSLCQSLTSIVIPEGVTRIAPGTFSGCSALTEIVIPDSMQSISSGAFNGCSSLTSVTIPNGVTDISSDAFPSNTLIYCYAGSYADSWAKENDRGDNVRYLSDATGPESITLPENISVALGEEKLVKRTIVPNGVYDIHWTSADPNIASVSENGAVTGISEGATIITIAHSNGTSASCTVTVTPERIIATGNCGTEGDNLQWTLGTMGILNIHGTGKMADYEISNDYEGSSTAPWNSYRSAIKSVTISEGVTSIGNSAFGYCTNLTSIAIPDSVTAIGDDAFYECSSLSSIAIPDSVTNIGDYAFSVCTSLTNIMIPDSVNTLNAGTFSDCTGLTSITIPDSVTVIGGSAFSGCTSLTSITIPCRVTAIGDYAFSGCSITSIMIPESVTSIGSGALPDNTLIYCYTDSYADKWAKENGMSDNVRYLNDIAITLPESITVVRSKETPVKYTIVPDGTLEVLWTSGNPAIASVSESGVVTGVSMGATTITATTINGISASCTVTVTSAEVIASGNCGAVGANVTWTLDSEGVLFISGTGAMKDYDYFKLNPATPWKNHLSEIKSVMISNGVTRIVDYAFSDCSNLMSIVIPEGVTSIGRYAFYQCSSLTSIAIPDSVTSIDSGVLPDNVLIYCYEFSYADGWAKNNGRSDKLRYLDGATEPVSISFPKDIYIARGSEKALHPIVIPSGRYSYRWTSSNPDIVSVSEEGVLTGVSAGYAAITAAYGDCIATTKVYCYVECESLAFTESEIWVIAQKTCPLHIDFRPDGAFEPIRYASSNTIIAEVDDDGLISAKSVGNVTITATSLLTGQVASALVHVCYPAQTVEFSETEITVKPNATAQATAKAIARNGTVYENRFVTYVSSDPAIATVSESGMVTGVSEGTTTIMATIENGASASCTVIVTGHELHTSVEVEAAEPTCTEDGHTAGTKCAVCGKTLSGMEPIPALGHSVVEDAAIPATCTEAGRAAGTHCAVCDTVLSGGEEIPATGHTEIEVEEKPATCYEIGYTAGKKCSVCEAVLSGCEEIPMTDHVIVNDAYIAPTLTTAGCTAGSHCEICGTIVEAQRVIPALTDAPIIAIPKAVAEIAEETYINTAVEVVRLPDTCTKINARAFANCADLRIVEIPAASVDIADDAFVDSPNVVIVTHEGSAAQQYARAHDIPYLTYPAK